MFENNEEDKILLAKVQIETENLKEKDSNDGCEKEWRLKIMPSEKVIKQLTLIDATKKTSLKYSLNFKVYDMKSKDTS